MHPKSLFIRFYDSLCRLAERQALREMMVRRSDRLLADIGFEPSHLNAEIEAAIAALQIRRETERRVLNELAGFSDSELRDRGISRLDIRRVARDHAQQAMEARRAEARARAA